MTAVTFLPGEEEAVPPARSRGQLPRRGTKARRRPTLMRTWGQLPRRTTPSRGPEKTRSASAIPAAGRQDSPPFRRPQSAANSCSSPLPLKLGERETAPPQGSGLCRRASVSRPSAAPGERKLRLPFFPRSARPAFHGRRGPLFCRLKTKRRKGESGNLLPFGVF